VSKNMNRLLKALYFMAIVCHSSFVYGAQEKLNIVAKTAPIVPHGLNTGNPLDITLSFVDLNPVVPGIAMKKGGTVKVILPKEIINTGFPVSQPGGVETCKPPVFTRCSSAGLLDGWPQSPLLPFSMLEYDEASHSLLLTSTADAPPYSLEAPGAKLIHLITFGFMNPDEPGEYPVSLEIKPDPASDTLLAGTTMLDITDKKAPNIAIDTTQSIHIKGPRYQNTMFQTLSPGATSRNMSSNMWNELHEPIVGASITMTSNDRGNLLAEDGTVIGSLSIDAPTDAKGFYLMSAPSFETKTGLAGYPTGRLVTALKTAPKVKGTYVVTLSLNDGNETIHTLNVQ